MTRRRPAAAARTAPTRTAPATDRPSSLPRNLAIAYGLLIIYACLHPFTGWKATGLPLFDFLVAPWPKYFIPADMVFNILGYLPLGFVAAAALPRAWPAWSTVALATLLCALLSFALETTQNFLPTRVASNLDLAANTAGALLGAAFGARWGHPLFDHSGALQRWRNERIIDGHTGDAGLILLGLWVLGQLTPDDLLFGSGDIRSLFGIAAPLRFAPERFIAFETALSATTIVALGLLVRCMMRRPSPWPVLVLIALGIGAKTLATATFFVPSAPLAWLTPGAERGALVGAALLLASLALPRVVQHAIAGTTLLAATALVNLLPENPYLLYNLSFTRQSNFLNFHGLTQLVDSLWPFAALAYLSALGLWRGQHLAEEHSPRR
ncbi:VanZ family protein [Azoarcus indigens]|uniref:VanZ family protein n=1 Tax=Azoarcus indigens TaxID=29545 RepID=A0A4R6E3Q3_9RHOO|nr:VanZ family protein [Azoarcus indigens]NMG67756.1 VanZ family protein [Azoarcus indigens]TDN51468.1 VanZ family protein [Azoarcus indigens]